MKFKFILVIIMAFFVLPFGANAEIKLLLNDLKRGDTSADVKVLQQILNQDPATRVASFGAGSPGYETMYFGTLTEAAVKKFQDKYKAEIFSLSGVLVSTGKLDLRTRTKMNTLTVSRFVADQNLELTPVIQDEKKENNNYLSITSISPENPTPGETLNIYGTGFSRTSLVYVGMDNKVSFDYVNSEHVKVKIPSNADPEAPLVYIRNPLGDTRWTDPVFALITDKKITTSSDTKAKNGLKAIQKANDDQTRVVAKIDLKKKTGISFVNIIKEIFEPTKKAYAFSINQFYGGGISQTYYCTCYYDFGIILDIDDKASDMTYTTVFKPLMSTLHKNYNVYTSGPNVVGGTMQTHFECNDTYIIPPAEPVCEQSTSGGTSAESMIDILRGTGTSVFGGGSA